MNIHIYAICKNEEKNIERWINCCKEADSITLLDTGSTDKTVELARGRGATVFEFKLDPFRFDVARNISLSLTPDSQGLYLPLDIDMFLRKDAVDILKKEYSINRFGVIWFGQRWANGKIGKWMAHTRYSTWCHPVYEQVHCEGDRHVIDNVLIDHEQEHPVKKLEWYEHLSVTNYNGSYYRETVLKEIRDELQKMR